MSEKNANELMQIVLEHYIKHHELVLKKLIHAQKATELSLQKLKEASTEDTGNVDEQWSEIITIFRDFGASEDELFGIEDLLGTVPSPIKEPYIELVDQDVELQKLKLELNSEEYLSARKAVQKVQAEPNPITGMTAEEYIKSAEESGMVKALKFAPHVKKR